MIILEAEINSITITDCWSSRLSMKYYSYYYTFIMKSVFKTRPLPYNWDIHTLLTCATNLTPSLIKVIRTGVKLILLSWPCLPLKPINNNNFTLIRTSTHFQTLGNTLLEIASVFMDEIRHIYKARLGMPALWFWSIWTYSTAEAIISLIAGASVSAIKVR